LLRVIGSIAVLLCVPSCRHVTVEVLPNLSFKMLLTCYFVLQVKHMRKTYGSNVKFILMNSFSTSDDTKQFLGKKHGDLIQVGGCVWQGGGLAARQVIEGEGPVEEQWVSSVWGSFGKG